MMIAYTYSVFVFWAVFLPAVANGADVFARIGHRVQRPKDVLAADQRQTGGRFLKATKSMEIDRVSFSCTREGVEGARPSGLGWLRLRSPDGSTQTSTCLTRTRRTGIV